MYGRWPDFKHIAGSESEYGASPELLEEELLYQILEKRMPFAPSLVFKGDSDFVSHDPLWLKNMGGFYLDMGFHPEYSTPECSNSLDVLTWEKAGDFMLMQAVADFNQKLWHILQKPCKEKRPCPIHSYSGILQRYLRQTKIKPGREILRIYKNCVDTKGTTYGAHENHFVLNSAKKPKLHQALFLHLASRVIWQGAGTIWEEAESGKPLFFLSQREPFMGQTIGGSGQDASKGMICDRSELKEYSPLGWRLHIICGDANMSEFVIRLKYITTAMLIFMAESEFPLQDRLPKLEGWEILEMFKTFSRDSTLQATFSCGNHKLRAVDVEQALLDCAKDFFAKCSLEINEDIKWGLKNWQYVLDLLRSSNPWEATAGITDCATKKLLIEKDMARLNYHWQSSPEQMLNIPRKNGSAEPMSVLNRLKWWDLEYHRLAPEGIFFRLNMRRATTQEKIDQAIINPPPRTRAVARKKAIERICKNPKRLKIDGITWNNIRVELKLSKGQHEIIDIKFEDPFRTEPVYPPRIYEYILNWE